MTFPLPQGTPKVGSRSICGVRRGGRHVRQVSKPGGKVPFRHRKPGLGPHLPSLLMNSGKLLPLFFYLRAGAKELMHLISTRYQYNCLLFRQKSRMEGANLTAEAAAPTCYHCAQYQFSIPLPHRSLRPPFPLSRSHASPPNLRAPLSQGVLSCQCPLSFSFSEVIPQREPGQ